MQEINPGVTDKLLRDGYGVRVVKPYPGHYVTKNGQSCQHIEITDKGRALFAG